MLRRIWNRTVALAVPIMLAICLPPLAVIAVNLHAESATVTSHAQTRAALSGTTSETEKTRPSREPHQTQKDQTARRPQQKIISVRN